tara:strand:+ start:480 stop:773 length:294 start_codon:yes stop_codon:yes gene_type:complete
VNEEYFHVYSPSNITFDGYIQIRGRDDVDIVGSMMEFDFTGAAEPCEVIFTMTNEDVQCPKCLATLPKCLTLKTTIGDILACRACNEFVRVVDLEEE